MDVENLPPNSREVAIELQLQNTDQPVRIPFTDVELAAKWTTVLRQEWQKLQS